MNKYFLSFIILGAGLTISAVIIGIALAQAQTASNIQYPVAELGNCQSETACKSYCDKPENLQACLAFAEKNNLMTSDELQQAKKFADAGGKGPGGCTSKDACETYCNDISHIDECIAYAEANGIIPPNELAEAKKVQAAIQKGIKPPPCGNKKSCDAYCENPDNMEVCISFAKEAGLIEGKEAQDADKMLQAIKRGVKPPPCKGKEACDAYCNEPANLEVCMNFAIEAGFMSESEKTDAQKMLQAVKNGAVPPKCKGKEECDAYCATDEHFEECMNFAIAAGMMDPKDAEMAKKTKGKGPGGCRGKEECETFCNNPDNQQICFNFAKDNGLIPAEDLQKMEQGKTQMKQALESAPPQVIECLTNLLGADMMQKLKDGTAMPSKDIGDKMGSCFGQSGPGIGPSQPCKSPEECKAFCEQNPQQCDGDVPKGPGGPGGPGPLPGPGGPGGCKTQEECQKYCSEHPNECQAGPGGPGTPPPGGPVTGPGPGGCQSPEECQAYCQAHPQECKGGPGEPPPTTGPAPGPWQGTGEPCTGSGCPPTISPPQQPPQGFQPPQGLQPPANMQPPANQQMMQPPTNQMMPPPTGPAGPAPQPSSLNQGSLFGWMFKVFGF